jgi:hypothetical protein
MTDDSFTEEKARVAETSDQDPRQDDVDPGEFDDDLEDADSTALLVGILAELQAVNQQLADLRGEGVERGESEEAGELVFDCTRCDATVLEGERREHAERAHNAPPGVSLGELFEEKE